MSQLAESTGRLVRDRVFQVAAVLLFVVLVPYIVPLLDEEQAWWWDVWLVNLLLYGVALAAVLTDATRLPSAMERRYWRLLGFSMGSMVGLYVVGIAGIVVGLDLYEYPAMALVDQGVYLMFYMGFFLALDASRPMWADALVHELRWVRVAGVGVVLGGLWAYFAVVPTLVFRDDSVAWVSVLLTYTAVDALLCLQFFRARSQSGDPRWRSILGWTAAALAAWTVVDFSEVAFELEWMEWMTPGSSLELQWYVPVFLFVIGARIHLSDPPGTLEAQEDRSVLFSGGPLIAYVAVLPLIHFTLYATGVLAPELRSLREVVVLGTVVVAGGLAWYYQRSVERQNRITHGELQESREEYRTFVESSVEGIWRLAFDPPVSTEAPEVEQMAQIFRQGRVVESNEAMAAMYDFPTAADCHGVSLATILQPVKNSTTNVDSVRTFIRSGYRVVRAPLEFVDATGRMRWFEGSLVGAVEGGGLVGAWATQVDITARVEAEAAKEEMQQQLRRTQRLETIGTLAGGIAHDFNNMLSPILGYTELAQEALPPKDVEVHEYLGQVTTAAERAKALVSQILAVGRHQEGSRAPVDVEEVAEEAIEFLRQSLPAYVVFETDFEAGCPQVMADAGQLHQVVMNLCTNARQAIGNRAGSIRVTLGVVDVRTAAVDPPLDPGRYLRLAVQDDGAGMSRETLDRAFEAFYTTKAVGEGSGLGLSVSHGIVEGHGGQIHIASEEGVGTTVSVFLPASSAARATATAVEEAGPRVGFPGVRVMLVDDDVAVAALGRVMLEGLGCQVTVFTDSERAQEALTRDAGSFDLLVTDHTMPKVTGPQLVAQAQALNPDMGTVLASGYRMDDGGTEEGQAVFLAKPFSRAEFERAVSHALASRGQAGALA